MHLFNLIPSYIAAWVAYTFTCLNVLFIYKIRLINLENTVAIHHN